MRTVILSTTVFLPHLFLTAYALNGGGQQVTLPRAAETTNSQPDVAPGPSLDETITFLNDSLKPENASLTTRGTLSGHGCEVMTNQYANVTYALEEGPELKTEKDGSSKIGYSWHMYKQPPTTGEFSLKDIDPASILSGGTYSSDFISVEAHHAFENHLALSDADLTFVLFETRNDKEVIRFGILPDEIKEGLYVPLDRSSSSGRFIFHNRERAERFVTAFKHAVVLCGGKTSNFAPTPSVTR